ncbi:MAG: hypothetical protein GY820_34730 [Gammaproteobacteria bacterium]|nr:hypothetical protein [Gammaproteobacteria bacterium]
MRQTWGTRHWSESWQENGGASFISVHGAELSRAELSQRRIVAAPNCRCAELSRRRIVRADLSRAELSAPNCRGPPSGKLDTPCSGAASIFTTT